MGTRAFVARRGWRDTPIGLDEWAAAVAESPDFEMHQGPDGEARAMLLGSTRRRLTWHDGYLAAHHTDARMAHAVFALAERLGAGVYSEQRHPYADLDDWMRRTGQDLPRAPRRAMAVPASGASRPDGWVWMVMIMGLAAVLTAELI